MTVPLWMLIVGIPLALIGALVVAFLVPMLADEIRLARRRQAQPALDHPLAAFVEDRTEWGRW